MRGSFSMLSSMLASLRENEVKKLIHGSILISGIAGVLFCFSIAHETDLNVNGKVAKIDCEECLAKELSTTAVYINNHCMVKAKGAE